MKYPYSQDYQPPIPAIPVTLANSDEGLRTDAQNALIDTGSDGTLVPIGLLEDILAPALTETRIRSHWGEWRSVQIFLLDIEFNRLKLPGVLVVGDDEGSDVVLGRNLLNRLHMVLDGHSLTTEIKES